MLLICHAVGWVSDEPWPGWVEVQLTDANGQRWSFFDKPPIFDPDDRLTPTAAYPVEVALQCQVIDETTHPDGERIFRVQMRWCDGLPTQLGDRSPAGGQTRFDVRPDQLRPA